MDFTVFGLLMDVGMISVLLIIGTFMRRHFEWFRNLLIPAPITAGLLGLIFGPEVLGWMPFSGALGDYSTVLIAVVFASMPYSMTFASKDASKAKNMWAFSTSMFLGQWGLFILLGLLLFAPVFGAPEWFGMMLPVGFVGGFGTAAAVGGAFGDMWCGRRHVPGLHLSDRRHAGRHHWWNYLRELGYPHRPDVHAARETAVGAALWPYRG